MSNVTKDSTIHELGLSVRGFNVCDKNGIETIGDLCNKTAKEIAHFYNCGRHTLNEYRAELLKHGLYLAGENPNEKYTSQPVESEHPYAYPQFERVGDIGKSCGGMTLRDYFAAAALDGIISSEAIYKIDEDDIGTIFRPSRLKKMTKLEISISAYGWADAMMEARKQ